MKRSAALICLFAMAIAGALLDIASKVAVFRWLGGTIGPEGELLRADPAVAVRELAVIPGFFNLHLSLNPGAAFSMFLGWTGFLTVFSLAAVLILAAIVATRPRTPKLALLAYGGIAAGALGNLWDRLHFGVVRDFIDWYWGSHHWPTFNLADSFISCSVVALLIAELFFVRREAPEPPTSKANDAGAAPKPENAA